MNQHSFAAPPPGHFTLAVNMIYNSQFVHAGTAMPLARLKEIPATLRKEQYIIRHDPNASIESPADDAPASLTFTTSGQQYSVDEQGFRRAKNVEREIIRLQQADDEQRMIEGALSQSNEQEQAALAIVQSDFESAVAREHAAAAYRARKNDMGLQLAAGSTAGSRR
jgi:hypothetical protein